VDTDCIQDGYKTDTQVRLGKDSIGEVSIGKEKEDKSLSLSHAREKKSADKSPYGEFDNVMLTEDEFLKTGAVYRERRRRGELEIENQKSHRSVAPRV